MRAIKFSRAIRALTLCLFCISLAACGRQESPATAEPEVVETVSTKVPVTTSSEQALALYNEAQTLIDNLHFTEARPILLQAVAADPNFAMAYVLMAGTSQTGAEFFAVVEKAQANAAGASDGEQLIIYALAGGARNDQAAQLTALRDLVALHPADERTHNRLANYYNGQQDYDNALTHYGHAVAINPEFATAFNSMGYAHRANDDLDGARAAFATYVELIPDEANPYDSYAELLMEMGQHAESIENYRKSLAIDRNFSASYAGISINESLRGDVDAALEAAAQMLSVARTPGERRGAIFQSVLAHLFADNVDAAIAACEEIYAIASSQGDNAGMGGVRQYMGDIMVSGGDGTKAREYYDDALSQIQQADINDANKAQATRAHLYKSALAAMVNDDYDGAVELSAQYSRAAESNGTSFERRRIHALEGYLALIRKEYDTAVTELAQANSLNPVVLYWSAVANRDAGDIEKAKELSNRAANRNTLSANLPFRRDEALELLASLSAM
jgi:tetratricopeptide (TPR) repeat protein